MNGGWKSILVGLGTFESIRAHHNVGVLEQGTLMDPDRSHYHGMMGEMGAVVSENANIFTTSPGDISDAVIGEFPYIEHKENVSLALGVCKYFGVDERTALHGMFTATPDPGVSQIYTIDLNGKTITYIGALAANDP